MYSIYAKRGKQDLGYLYFDKGIHYTLDKCMALHYKDHHSAEVMLGLVRSADCVGAEYSVVECL